jgi:hypothetical protein
VHRAGVTGVIELVCEYDAAMTSDLLDLDAAATLAEMETACREARRREVRELQLSLRWADLHARDPQRQPGAVPLSRGGDHLIDLGGDGTPSASELCWSELAIARGAGVLATKNHAADALDLRHRLPLLWDAVQDLQLPVWVARKVASMSRKLTKIQCEIVDAAVAAAIEESAPRILEIAEAKVIEADLEAHQARLAADAAKIGVTISRPRPGESVDDVDGEPGTRRVVLKLPAGTALDFDATVDEIADLLWTHSTPDPALPEDTDRELTRGELEAKAVELLTNPHAAAAFLDQITTPPRPRPRAMTFPRRCRRRGSGRPRSTSTSPSSSWTVCPASLASRAWAPWSSTSSASFSRTATSPCSP